jgi:hypothetical protein
MVTDNYNIDIFINCPFDIKYKPLFESIVFSVFDCGFRPRCALELADSSEVRIDKIFRIISECKYGIHDISRTSLDSKTKLPRFNMPLELGMFLATKRFGKGRQKNKICLIMDSEQYRYQKFISDISGQDIKAHENKPKIIISIIRDWLGDSSQRPTIPGGSEIYRRYRNFQSKLPSICRDLKVKQKELTFNVYAIIISEWLKQPEQASLVEP